MLSATEMKKESYMPFERPFRLQIEAVSGEDSLPSTHVDFLDNGFDC